MLWNKQRVAGNNSEKDLRTSLILMMMLTHTQCAEAWVSTRNGESGEDCILLFRCRQDALWWPCVECRAVRLVLPCTGNLRECGLTPVSAFMCITGRCDNRFAVSAKISSFSLSCFLFPSAYLAETPRVADDRVGILVPQGLPPSLHVVATSTTVCTGLLHKQMCLKVRSIQWLEFQLHRGKSVTGKDLRPDHKGRTTIRYLFHKGPTFNVFYPRACAAVAQDGASAFHSETQNG